MKAMTAETSILRLDTISDNCKLFKNDDKCFLFHRKVFQIFKFLS